MKAFLGKINNVVRFIGKMFLSLTGWLMILALLALLVPGSYFLWRAHQPMTLPEYNGLSYAQFAEWRGMMCAKENAGTDKECLPVAVVVGGDIMVTAVPFIIVAWNYPDDMLGGPPAQLLPGLWNSFESNTWKTNKSWLRAPVPSPEQFAQMR
jgi:hypothetical protein